MNLFEGVKIGLYIIFVAAILATPFIIAKRFDVDLITLIKKWMGKNRERSRKNDAFDQGYRKGFGSYAYVAPKGIFECENGMCTRKVDVGEHGAFIRSAGSGRRKIVCSECAEAFIKTGWIPVMTWGDSFKSSSAALMIVGGSLLSSIPLFLGGAPTLLNSNWNPGILLVRLMLYGLAGIVIHWIVWGAHEE